jgi:hypothetical protein
MTTKTTRRAILAGAAALPAFTVPALAIGQTDPIFAAIERHKRLEAIYVAYCNDEKVPDNDDHIVTSCYNSGSAYADLVAMTPTTAAGCAAMLRHLESHEAAYCGSGLFDNCNDRVRLPGKDLLSRIAYALDGKVVQS